MTRVPVWKISLIVFTLLLTCYLLMPTYEFYSYNVIDRSTGNTPKIIDLEAQKVKDGADVDSITEQILQERKRFRTLREKSIGLGMDLQGGVHLVMEVDHDKFEKELRSDPNKTEQEVEYALDTALDQAMSVIENRVDAWGVTETALVKQPPWRLILEMPGQSDPNQVRNLVQAEAKLSFHLVPDRSELGQLIPDIDAAVPEDFQGLLANADQYVAAVAVSSPDNVNLVDEILKRPAVQAIIPNKFTFKWSGLEEPSAYNDFEHKYLYLLEANPAITGARLDDAWVFFDPVTSRPEVMLTFDRAGARTFSRITGDHVREHLAVVMNDQVYTAPRIKDRIRDGRASISGIGDYEEARQIAVVLRAGALPTPLTVAEQRVVGPSLGRDSIQKGLMSGIIGAIIVLVFMVVYYSLVGVIADIAVLLNLFLLLAGMAMFNATLTVPGIAGIVLTVGMAVDANVLIYERLREEMAGKRAKTIQLILDKGYGRAFMTIFDANITTLITALVLFQFGTGPIKGFAVTLSLGILISMFTAIFVSRVILDVMVARGMKNLSLGSIFFFANAKYDFFRRPILLMSITGGIGIAGFIFLCFSWGSLQGIDFAGGKEIQVQFNEAVPIQDVRSSLANVGLPKATIQEILGGSHQMMIRVQHDTVETGEALKAKIKEALPDKPFETLQTQEVGSKVGSELLLKGLYCIIFSSFGILLYITARFEFRFAVAAVICLFHDLLFTLAVLAITRTEFNLPIIAALLTVLGYSLNDTIVVFDRIRENYTSGVMNFKEIVNISINQTLSRTVNTSMTTLFVICTLYLFGGSVIHDFSFTLLIGIVIGTYSSICVASPLLTMLGGHRELLAIESKKQRQQPASAS